MSDIIQWIIVAVIVAVAVVFLVKRLKPSKKGCCCAGCPYAGACGVAKDNPETRPRADD